MHVLTSPLIDTAAVVVARNDQPVLILRENLLSPADLSTLRAVCACLTAVVAPALQGVG